ncbi:MAG: aspartate-semialdehyde dehydrogenase [Planctomycetota bacterium]
MSTVAVVGATGVVGRELLDVLAERAFPVDQVRLLASKRSAGQTMEALGELHEIREATPDAFDGVDLALFSAGSDIAKALAPAARKAGALVVDNSSAFRMDPDCPLVVPELNGDLLASHNGIIGNPNCSTILLTMALAPLHRAGGLARVVMSSYQAVSGAGAPAIEELRAQEDAERLGEEPIANVFPTVLAHNVIPWVAGVQPDGFTVEEHKVRNETRRILALPDLPVTATCVRVPVWRAHSEAVHVELQRPVDAAAAAAAYDGFPGIRFWTDRFPTPRDAAHTNEVHVGRLRADPALPNGWALWAVMDQLRKGAALNAIQIAERAMGISVGA